MGDSSSGKTLPGVVPLADDPFDPFDGDLENSLFEESVIGIQTEQMAALETAISRSERQSVPQTFTNVDPFANINACNAEHIERLAHILEIRGAQPRQTKMRQACFSAAGLNKGMSILELGCGTGVVTRELARIAGRNGRVVGIDVSAALLNYARGRSVAGGVTVEYMIGDAYKLAFDDNSFDASCCVTLFAHLHNLERVVREMIRVARRTVMLLDQDYQTLLFENSNTKLTRKILQHGADYNVLDGWCGRKLPGLLVSHGMQNVQCWPFVYSERDSQSYLITIAERFAALATGQGVVTQQEGKEWLQELYDRAVEGTFFASLNYYFAFGSKAP